MLARPHDRLGNEPAREILIAAAEQAKITALGLTLDLIRIGGRFN